MKASIFKFGVLILLLVWLILPAQAQQGVMVRGSHFEGVILTSAMMNKDYANYPTSMFNTGVWTPSENLVRQAELHLPAALDRVAPSPKVLRTFYVPQFYTPKGAKPVAGPGHARVEDNLADSVEDNFLYLVQAILPDYKRQYIGVTIHGTKYLLLSFIDASCVTGDPEINKEWGHRWVEVLDGGDDFWDVLYDPATGKFSEWECNGSA